MCEENSSLISNNNAYGGIFLPSDNYVDLSDLNVDLSDLYDTLSDLYNDLSDLYVDIIYSFVRK